MPSQFECVCFFRAVFINDFVCTIVLPEFVFEGEKSGQLHVLGPRYTEASVRKEYFDKTQVNSSVSSSWFPQGALSIGIGSFLDAVHVMLWLAYSLSMLQIQHWAFFFPRSLLYKMGGIIYPLHQGKSIYQIHFYCHKLDKVLLSWFANVIFLPNR